MGIKVDNVIHCDEVLVRCLLHSIWANGGKMVREALLPKPGHKDVSLLRLKYTDLDFCKKQAKSLKVGNSIYWGLGAFVAMCVEEVNGDSEIEIQANVISSPIDENNCYIEDGSCVTTDTLGLPMHADLLYAEPTTEGTPATKHRIYARKLLKLCQYKQDPNPMSLTWDAGGFAVIY